MKTPYTEILFCCFSFLILFSCENEKKIQPAHANLVENSTERPPEIVPKDAYIHTLSNQAVNSDDPTWIEFDQYYREEVMLENDKPYFENLQWMTIAMLIDFSGFLPEAEVENKIYYLNEMVSRKFVNNPKVALALLDNLSEANANIDIPAYARQILEINKSHFSTDEDFKKHKESHANSYVRLMSIGWTRWGQEK